MGIKENPAQGGAVLLGGSNSSESIQGGRSAQDMFAQRAAIYRHLENCIDVSSALQRRFCEIHRDFRQLRLTPAEAEDLIEDAWNELVPDCERTRQQFVADLVRQWEAADRRDRWRVRT